jgi:hypothetical protein
MPEYENDFMKMWIYSYLKYGGVVTQEQRERSKRRFLDYVNSNEEAFLEDHELEARQAAQKAK